MKGIRWISLCAAAALLLTGCGKNEGGVYVQSVAELAQVGGIAPGDRFGGLVVSENVVEIQKDGEKKIKELAVRAGDDVTEGQLLFSYDTEELQLALDKQRLEAEQLRANMESYEEQIAQLEKDRQRAGSKAKLQYTVQIQTAQISLKEAEINLKTKDAEIQKSEELLNNANVTSPVDGRIQAISENGTDSQGNPLPFISIQQAGSYRVKGIIGELQQGSIVEGDRILMTSRSDADRTWLGTVTLVDYANPSQGNQNQMYDMGNADEMSNSSRYPFYIELDSSEGLLLGQHLYLELYREEDQPLPTGLNLDSSFICIPEDGTSYVWADNGKGKLQKRAVVLGQYNDLRGTYEILEGLSDQDYIAFPDETLCIEGARTTKTAPVTEELSGEVE